ncbi:hypothetical protein DFH08DRAFT_941512 [Mycena albidolilacea]|uniref:Uncharacterized protein n=1 Tax=Mycena albidolilacea TaxID=1033008 RepID=A0AAD6ZHE3_9AGAR|nr:hypothetical protein DFH08DRAFT_941512 [Mycena albidolilacea]
MQVYRTDDTDAGSAYAGRTRVMRGVSPEDDSPRKETSRILPPFRALDDEKDRIGLSPLAPHLHIHAPILDERVGTRGVGACRRSPRQSESFCPSSARRCGSRYERGGINTQRSGATASLSRGREARMRCRPRAPNCFSLPPARLYHPIPPPPRRPRLHHLGSAAPWAERPCGARPHPSSDWRGMRTRRSADKTTWTAFTIPPEVRERCASSPSHALEGEGPGAGGGCVVTTRPQDMLACAPQGSVPGSAGCAPQGYASHCERAQLGSRARGDAAAREGARDGLDARWPWNRENFAAQAGLRRIRPRVLAGMSGDIRSTYSEHRVVGASRGPRAGYRVAKETDRKGYGEGTISLTVLCVPGGGTEGAYLSEKRTSPITPTPTTPGPPPHGPRSLAATRRHRPRVCAAVAHIAVRAERRGAGSAQCDTWGARRVVRVHIIRSMHLPGLQSARAGTGKCREQDVCGTLHRPEVSDAKSGSPSEELEGGARVVRVSIDARLPCSGGATQDADLDEEYDSGNGVGGRGAERGGMCGVEGGRGGMCTGERAELDLGRGDSDSPIGEEHQRIESLPDQELPIVKEEEQTRSKSVSRRERERTCTLVRGANVPGADRLDIACNKTGKHIRSLRLRHRKSRRGAVQQAARASGEGGGLKHIRFEAFNFKARRVRREEAKDRDERKHSILSASAPLPFWDEHRLLMLSADGTSNLGNEVKPKPKQSMPDFTGNALRPTHRIPADSNGCRCI